MIKHCVTALVCACLSAPSVADVTGAYGRTTNNGVADTYIVAVQRGDTVLVTYHILGMSTPGLFGGTAQTNITSFGVGALDRATQSARVTLSGFGQGSHWGTGACKSVGHVTFTTGGLTYQSLGTTCAAASNAPEAYALVY